MAASKSVALKPSLPVLPSPLSGAGCREVRGPPRSPADENEKGPSEFSLLAGKAPAGFPTN